MSGLFECWSAGRDMINVTFTYPYFAEIYCLVWKERKAAELGSSNGSPRSVILTNQVVHTKDRIETKLMRAAEGESDVPKYSYNIQQQSNTNV